MPESARAGVVSPLLKGVPQFSGEGCIGNFSFRIFCRASADGNGADLSESVYDAAL